MKVRLAQWTIGGAVLACACMLGGCSGESSPASSAGSAIAATEEVVATVTGPVVCTAVEGPCRMPVNGTVRFESDEDH
jgi:hypothetical protein